MPRHAACLIALPSGLAVSGVARFAVRLAGALAERGHPAGLLLHAPSPGTAPLELPIDPRVRVFDLGGLPPIEVSVDADTFAPHYLDAARALDPSGPATLVLGQHAGVFEAAAPLTAANADAIRCVGVAHSDNGYDARVLAHYEPMLHGLVGVSDCLTDRIRKALPQREADIRSIPYGVELGEPPTDRAPIGGRPLRLLYAGRLDHRQKRVLALPLLSAELTARGIDHTLTIVGDGPARAELTDRCRGNASIELGPAVPPSRLVGLLDGHDAFVLPSRFEGLSIAMLEALARGCIPVVAPSDSGTPQAVIPGVTGEIARATPDDDERAVASAMADAIDALRRRDLVEMARRCRRHAEERFGLDGHAEAWRELLERVAAAPARAWPADRPMAFDAPSASGSVPADALERARRVVKAIGDEPVAVHGAGAHTRGVAPALASARVVCITDDDRQRHGETMLGVPIVAPDRAAEHGARHVIISTHLHETDVWRRREVYERQGLVVHRLYGE